MNTNQSPFAYTPSEASSFAPAAGTTSSDLRPASGTESTPDRLLQLGFGFWASKVLLSAVELGVFTELAKAPRTAPELGKALGLHPRGLLDFLDTLVALEIIDRENGLYRNRAEADVFLDRAKPTYIGGILEMCNARLYAAWGNLTQGLRTGEPQNQLAGSKDVFAELYAEPARLEQFLSAMTGLSMGAARAIASAFPWEKYKTFLDVGGAQGGIGVQIALAHRHLRGGNFDLKQVEPVFTEYVRSFGLQDRLTFTAGDFFNDPLPATEVIIMGHILHDWDLEQKMMLIAKAYAALPSGGAFIVYESIIDDERRKNTAGLLMSLNMLIETKGGFDFTGADCVGWMKAAGFKETRVEQLCGPESMVVGFK